MLNQSTRTVLFGFFGTQSYIRSVTNGSNGINWNACNNKTKTNENKTNVQNSDKRVYIYSIRLRILYCQHYRLQSTVSTSQWQFQSASCIKTNGRSTYGSFGVLDWLDVVIHLFKIEWLLHHIVLLLLVPYVTVSQHRLTTVECIFLTKLLRLEHTRM